METQTVNKTMVSMRLDARTLALIETAQSMRGTAFAGKTRTWLVEQAVERMLGDLIRKNGSK